ncbi:hypothetical protein RLV_4083 [Rhizobium leguminosarum bv. viciae]|nr:hypothetical protein RLV_4083 [Rhizobium leguminosarum bv. viciae]
MGSGLSRHGSPSVGGTFTHSAARGQNMPSSEWQAISPDAAMGKRKYLQGDSRALYAQLGKPLNSAFPDARKAAIRRQFS